MYINFKIFMLYYECLFMSCFSSLFYFSFIKFRNLQIIGTLIVSFYKKRNCKKIQNLKILIKQAISEAPCKRWNNFRTARLLFLRFRLNWATRAIVDREPLEDSRQIRASPVYAQVRNNDFE